MPFIKLITVAQAKAVQKRTAHQIDSLGQICIAFATKLFILMAMALPAILEQTILDYIDPNIFIWIQPDSVSLNRQPIAFDPAIEDRQIATQY